MFLIRTLLTSLLFFCYSIVCAKSNIDSLYATILKNDDSITVMLIERIEKKYKEMDEGEKSDYLYLKGIYLEKNGLQDEALDCFKESAEIADHVRCYEQSYYDAILRLMLYSSEKSSYFECVKYGFKASNTPMQDQRGYPNMHRIYSLLVTAMLHASLFADIPNIVKRGDRIIREQVNSEDEEYFYMPISEAVAWLMMGNAEKAEFVYEKLNKEKSKSTSLLSSLSILNQEIVKAKEEKWAEIKARRFQQIDTIGNNLLLVNPATSEGSILWRDYFAMIRNSLEFFHFNTSDPKDEALWTKAIANMIVHFYVQCDNLPDREAIEYNNILCYKNFLNYHYGFQRKKPITWREIQDVLNDDEIAIEISCVPEDILIVKKDEPHPICIRIDSLLFEEITQLNNNDAISIDKNYSPEGPLAKMWNLIEPFIGTDIRTIFISGSNVFSEINYGAIALHEGLVSDKYEIHIMHCTSDIIEFKQNRSKTYKSACLIGGVDYRESKPMINDASNRFNAYEWNLVSILPQNMRSGFQYLPNTLKEVNEISHIMDSIGIVNTLRTGKEATEEFFKSINNQSPDIIHLATHGFMLAPLFNDTTAQKMRDDLGTQYQTVLSQSGLILSGANKKWEKNIQQKINDGILTSQEIAALNLSNINLAVLMACRSGLGGTTNLTGVPFGVAYAFRMAGVKQILCCLWDVEDEITSTMINYFYRFLFTTGNAKKALELSRQKLRDQGNVSPFYWAPFILIE